MNVSRETRRRLEIFERELRAWQKAINLVSPASLDAFWLRHVQDCLQLIPLAPKAERWVDLGAGAGLPGLVIAASDRIPHVTLVESDSRKCAFLRHAARQMGVAAEVVEGRIELSLAGRQADVVTARALAPLTRLLGYSQEMLRSGATGLFLKGRGYAAELTEAHESWTFEAEAVESRTDPESRILRITRFEGPRQPGDVK